MSLSPLNLGDNPPYTLMADSYLPLELRVYPKVSHLIYILYLRAPTFLLKGGAPRDLVRLAGGMP